MRGTSFTQQLISWLLFAAAFISFAYFHQGGGWNQNVRFVMVRSLVEEGTLWIGSDLLPVQDLSREHASSAFQSGMRNSGMEEGTTPSSRGTWTAAWFA
jgi:hypothetical protein